MNLVKKLFLSIPCHKTFLNKIYWSLFRALSHVVILITGFLPVFPAVVDY